MNVTWSIITWVRVLIAPDCFTGTLTAPQAAEAIATGWARHAPGDTLTLLPLADGGPGFLDVLYAALGGELRAVTVPGPLGEPAPAGLLVVGGTAYVETAQACGLHLVPEGSRDPSRTTSAGVGDLLAAARSTGATRVVAGLGGSATNDAGAGMLAALGAGPLGKLAAGGGVLGDVEESDLAALAGVRRDWGGVELVVASDVDVPLLGLHGASAVFAPQKGATPEQAQDLERALGSFADVACRAAGLDRSLTRAPGAGAAGGLGFGLMLLGARREPGTQVVIDAVGLREAVAAHEVVVTGEGSFDWQSLRGKVVVGVARTAMDIGTPVVVIAGQVTVGRREMQQIGVESAYAVAERRDQVAAALADPSGTLADRAERVARTWSR